RHHRQRLSRRGPGAADQPRRRGLHRRARHAHRPACPGSGQPAACRGAVAGRRDRPRRGRLRLHGHGVMSAPTPPRLVIFDCDGVLVNTEERANRILSDWLTSAGHVVTYEDCRRLYSGRSMKSVQAEIEEAGHALGFDLTQRWYGAIDDIFGAGVEAIPHVEMVLDALRERDVPWCVASSARVEKMHLTLGTTGLLPHFASVLYSATMVERGKPFPDLFLHAAREM